MLNADSARSPFELVHVLADLGGGGDGGPNPHPNPDPNSDPNPDPTNSNPNPTSSNPNPNPNPNPDQEAETAAEMAATTWPDRSCASAVDCTSCAPRAPPSQPRRRSGPTSIAAWVLRRKPSRRAANPNLNPKPKPNPKPNPNPNQAGRAHGKPHAAVGGGGRGSWSGDVGGYLHPHAPHPPSSYAPTPRPSSAQPRPSSAQPRPSSAQPRPERPIERPHTAAAREAASLATVAREAHSAHLPLRPQSGSSSRPQSGRRPAASRPASASVAQPRGRPQSARAALRGEVSTMYDGAAARGPNAYLDAALEASSVAFDLDTF